ncbi:hypothetical protein TNCV_406681 [Trichonephila clavipes]|nr:hypothetical protein TNCV_406681 [Trichonephila clavipes]
MLPEKRITVREHSPYSPDLVPGEFYQFAKLKTALKSTHFQTAGEVKAKEADILKEIFPDVITGSPRKGYRPLLGGRTPQLEKRCDKDFISSFENNLITVYIKKNISWEERPSDSHNNLADSETKI